MNVYLLVPVSLAYIGIAIDFYFRQKFGLSIAFAAYAVANIGFIYA